MASKANGGSGAQSGNPVLGATSTASLPTGVAYCTSWGSYEGRLPEIPRDLSRGSLAHAWWVSFGEQKWVSFAERQGRICGALHIRRFRLTTPLRILRHGIQKLAFSVFWTLASAMSSTVI